MRALLDDDRGRAALDRLRDVEMAVGVAAAQRNEERARRRGTRIDFDGCDELRAVAGDASRRQSIEQCRQCDLGISGHCSATMPPGKIPACSIAARAICANAGAATTLP